MPVSNPARAPPDRPVLEMTIQRGATVAAGPHPSRRPQILPGLHQPTLRQDGGPKLAVADECLPGRQVPHQPCDRIQALAQPRQQLPKSAIRTKLTNLSKLKEIIPTINKNLKPVSGDLGRKRPAPGSVLSGRMETALPDLSIPTKLCRTAQADLTASRTCISRVKVLISRQTVAVRQVGTSSGDGRTSARPTATGPLPDLNTRLSKTNTLAVPARVSSQLISGRPASPAVKTNSGDPMYTAVSVTSSGDGAACGIQAAQLTTVQFAVPSIIAVADANSVQSVPARVRQDSSDSESDSNNSDTNKLSPTVRLFARKADVTHTLPQKSQTVIRYQTDQGFRPLLCAFRNMQWRDSANRGRWHMFWANVANARALFQPGQRYYFNDDQLVNHYQSCYQLSRKDNMTKNIKKFRSEMAHLKDPIGRKDSHGNFIYLDLIAPTYLLPFDFNTFVAEFKKNGGLYIVKPCSGSQGQGIFLVNQLDQAKRWQERALTEIAACIQDNDPYQGYLISRYISNPLLIDGKKFDLRLYILVTSFQPLRCYYYRQGFCRFCATRYSPDAGNIDDKFMHLTNVAVQKQRLGYNRVHGNKWSITAFRMYMERVYGRGKIDALFDCIFWTIVQSLRSVQGLMDNDRHCYEMYGYDCLIDAHLKPWLLEINASPSLEDSTPVDRVIKTNLLIDTMRMALYERCPHLLGIKEKWADAADMPLGDYEVLYLEEPAPKLTPAERVKKANLSRYGSSTGVPGQDPAVPLGSDKPRWNSM